MTNTQLVSYAKAALLEAWGYVWGGQGEMYTTDLAKRWGNAKQGGKDYNYYVNTCRHWIGHHVTDCSGLIIAALQSHDPKYPDQASGTLFARCTETGKMASIPNVPGLLLYKPGHVGIYEGNSYALEARGVKYGVVRTALKGRGWTHWGYLRDIDYGNGGAADTPQTGTGGIGTMVVTRLLKQTSPMQVGDDVAWLQQRLNTAGHSVGSVDGIFGSRSKAAVMEYQRAQRLTTDGIAGRNTITALGGEYRG